MSTDLLELYIARFRDGYYNTDKLAYPDGAMAEGTENVLYTTAEGARPFRGLTVNSPPAGGRFMFDLATGYGSLNDRPTIFATGSVTLTGGASGSVDGITVNGVQIMSAPVSFNTDLPATATDVAANITAHTSIPNYTAAAVGAVITITAVTGGSGPNGFAVVSSTTTITTTDANMSGGGNTPAYGSIFNFINESLWWSGEGDVYLNGADSTFNASSSLQLATKAGGTYSTAYTAGLAQPTAPAVTERDPGVGFSGAMEGVYTFKIARVRSETGARSIASSASSAITCDEQTAVLTFPATVTGQDRWAIFGTRAGFGGVGVHYLYTEVADADLTTIDDVPRSYELEYVDADLLPIAAYIDDYPPPACLYSGRLENYILAIGCYDNAIATSIRNFPESFNPEHLTFLPSTPTAVLPDQLGSYMYVSTKSTVHAVSIAYSENPLMIQTVWANVGVAHSHNWCSAEGVIFAFVSRQGAVTMDHRGQPDTRFAVPVHNEMKGWEPEDTMVFYYPDLQSVVYANGSKVLLFNLNQRVWSSPIDLSDWESGSVISGVVTDRQLKISLLNGETFTLHDFDVNDGSDSTTYKVVSPDMVINPGGRINIHGLKGSFHHSNVAACTIELFTDYGSVADEILTHVAQVGMNTTLMSRWWVPRKEAFRIRFTATQSDFTKDSYLTHVVIFGTLEPTSEF